MFEFSCQNYKLIFFPSNYNLWFFLTKFSYLAKSLSFLRRKIAAPALIMMPKMLRMKVTTIVAFQPPLSTRPWIWGEEARYCMASLIKTISTFLFSLATLMSMWKFISEAVNETMEAHLAAFLLSAYASWREKGCKTTSIELVVNCILQEKLLQMSVWQQKYYTNNRKKSRKI